MSSSDAANPERVEVPLDEQDLGPLAWVLDELRKSLDGAIRALYRFVQEAKAARENDLATLDTTPLRVARQQLHQAAGALEMVAMTRPAFLLRALEAAVQRLMQRPQLCNDQAVQVFKRTSFALVEYLENVLTGKQISPVVLFPQYRDAQTLAAAERIHPADLWPLKRHLHEPDVALSCPALPYGSQARTQLDGAVLRIVKSGDATAASHLHEICLGLAAAQPRGTARAFWKICAGFFEALAHGLLKPDIYVKRVTSRVLMQYASLSKGDEALIDHLLQDLLFFCAQANTQHAAVSANLKVLHAVRKAFGLAQHTPIDYDTPRFGLFDPSVLSQARKRIAAAAETWSALAGGERLKLKLAVDQFALVCESLRTLHAGSEPLALALTRAIDSSARSGEPPTATLAMEVATAILYLQASFENLDVARDHMAERAKRLAARLDGVAAGHEPGALEPWMEELYRRVSDHHTMGNVVGELRATLAEAEKWLDQFFRQPDDVDTLKPVPSCLQKMRSVLQILELEQAAITVRAMREVVEHLLLGEITAEQRLAVFDRLGHNLGALGFLIDMLGYQPAMARKLFVYDEAVGELQLLIGRTASTAVEEVNQEITAVSPQASIEPESHPETAPDAQPEKTTTSATPLMPVADEEDDGELLDIFLEEAREVVETGLAAIVALRETPADMGEQTTLRRAFHTLKGSSRMVGLNDFGEAAWAMEQTLNAWLAEQKPMLEPLLQLSGRALRAFDRWANDIATDTAQEWRFEPFQAAAEAMRTHGTLLSLELAPTVGDIAQDSQIAAAKTEEDTLETFEVMEEDSTARIAEVPEAQTVEAAEEIEAADITELDIEELENTLENGADLPSLEIFPTTQVPAIEPADVPEKETSEMPLPTVPVDRFADTLIHSTQEQVAPSEPETVSDLALGMDFATFATLQPTEDETTETTDVTLSATEEAVTESAALADDVKVIGNLRIDVPLFNVFVPEADERAHQLVAVLQNWAQELYRPLPEEAIRLAHSLAGSSATVGFSTLSQLARTLEHALSHVQLQPPAFDLPACAECFNAAAADTVRLLQHFAAGTLETPDASIEVLLRRILETEIPTQGATLENELADDDWMADFADSVLERAPPSDTLPALPSVPMFPDAKTTAPVPLPEKSAPLAQPASIAPPSAADGDLDAQDAIDSDLFPIFEEEALELLPILGAALRQWSAHAHDADARSKVLRSLHTLKGSARLAGAMGLGERAHRMESAVEQIDMDSVTTQAVEPLLVTFDTLQMRFDALRRQGQEPLGENTATPEYAATSITIPTALETAPPVPAVSISTTAVPLSEDTQQSQPTPKTSVEPATTLPAQSVKPLARPVVSTPQRVSAREGQSVRVRAQLLDQLLSQTGEVMIARSRLNARMTQLRSALGDMAGNLDRLRVQLRDIEVQAESQMQSRMALSKEVAAGFDPLEFDRFTRVQELTRMLAESVNDVATVQRTMQRALEGAEDDLIAQGRQARELQRDLLRTRMVEFASISERLYAVVRLASRESGKQAKLDISGGSIEMDRGVLERMTPAFEHLLRNCTGHGIETPEERKAAGKDPVGTITIALRQEGNDISVDFRDDGAGLNLERIRAKAVAQGLIAEDTPVTEADATRLIFMPGFSTATQVTGLSGRGVGMDVVRTEINSLGGRIETTTVVGQGSSFRMVLPLTTAVTQVVMLRAGQLSFGVPASLIETVRRTTTEELLAAYDRHSLQDGEDTLPFTWAGALLQAAPCSYEASNKSFPVVLLRSASQRMALHVDEVLGNQEVVVKNLGPQLARLPGLAGMSVLPSGAVVLIYNPVALSTVYGEQVRQVMRAPAAEGTPVSFERDLQSANLTPLILVVDDSITVRRVTQRLLLREGYRVALAADGLQALERLQEERPAVVLSDIEMPRMDGFDLARNIRSDKRISDLPIIMITSRIAEKHREHAMELGVNHYLGKPYSEEQLLGLMQQYTHMATAQEAGSI